MHLYALTAADRIETTPCSQRNNWIPQKDPSPSNFVLLLSHLTFPFWIALAFQIPFLVSFEWLMMFSDWSGLPFTILTNVNRKCSAKPVVYWNERTQSFNGRSYNLQKDFLWIQNVSRDWWKTRTLRWSSHRIPTIAEHPLFSGTYSHRQHTAQPRAAIILSMS